MKIEVDFSDVLDEYVNDISSTYYHYDDDIKEHCEKLLGALPSYERAAQVIFDILENNSGIKRAFDEIVEENKE